MFYEVLHLHITFSTHVSRGLGMVRFAELRLTLSSGEPGCILECQATPGEERGNAEGRAKGPESNWRFQLVTPRPPRFLSKVPSLSGRPSAAHAISQPQVSAHHGEDLPDTLMLHHFWLDLMNSEE